MDSRRDVFPYEFLGQNYTLQCGVNYTLGGSHQLDQVCHVASQLFYVG